MTGETSTNTQTEQNHNSSSSHPVEKSSRLPTFKTSVELFAIRKANSHQQSGHDSIHSSNLETKLTALPSPFSNLKTDRIITKAASISKLTRNGNSLTRIRPTIDSSLTLLNTNNSQSRSALMDIPDYKAPRSIDFNTKGMGNGFISNSLRMPKVTPYPNSGPGPGSYQLKGIADLAMSHSASARNLKTVTKPRSYPILIVNEEKVPPVGTYDYSLDPVRKSCIVSCSNSFVSKTQKNYGIRKPEGPHPATYDIRGSEELQYNRLNNYKSSFFADPIEKKKSLVEISKNIGLDEQIGRKMEAVNGICSDAVRIHRTLEDRINEKLTLSPVSNKFTLKRPSPATHRYQSIRSIRKLVPISFPMGVQDVNKTGLEPRIEKSPRKFYL